jgi:ceramide synthetase
MPWGLRKGLKPTKNMINVILEETYRKNGDNLNHNQVIGLAKQLDWSVRQVEQWYEFALTFYTVCFLKHKIEIRIYYRKKQNKPSALVKLTESGWRFTYYSFAVCYGLWALWDKPWFWNIDECWTNYPHQVIYTRNLSIHYATTFTKKMQTVSWDIRFYYVFQLSCYWSMLFSQFVDVKRKDFLEMFIHHLTTILLIIFSYTCNLIRGGSLVLIIHDFSDVFMEAAKIFKYIKWQRGCDFCFGLFFIVWTVTRLIVFPGYLIKK